MTIVFRDSSPADAPALASLGAQTFTETFGHLYSPENLAAFLANHAEDRWRADLADPALAIRIGEADRQAVAYAKLGPPTLPFESQGKPIELRQFYILKPFQGRGAADDLIAWVFDTAVRSGADELYLSVFTDNHRARRFYDRHGFQPVGRYHFMVGDHADEDIIMRRPL
jgi:GNAT superfamily N-acetyltransferase